jgi:PTH1 family peptidyl-tRNA hydrolase
MLVLLGNTGSRYARTRHNAGWMLEETSLISGARPGERPSGGGPSWQQKFKGVWAHVTIDGERVVVLKPQTMMNLSGESVQAAARFFKLPADQVAVAHDDVELPFGELGVRLGGGLAGHNGLRSVAHCLGTRDFWRVRIGVGRPRHGELHGHVLGRFTPDEEAQLPHVLESVADLVRRGYREGFRTLPARTKA